MGFIRPLKPTPFKSPAPAAPALTSPSLPNVPKGPKRAAPRPPEQAFPRNHEEFHAMGQPPKGGKY